MTQKELILEYVKHKGSITHFEATRLHPPVLVLHKRISELEAKGHRWKHEPVKENGKHFVRHHYQGFRDVGTEQLINQNCSCGMSGFFSNNGRCECGRHLNN